MILQDSHFSENGILMSIFLSYSSQFLCPCKRTNLKQIVKNNKIMLFFSSSGKMAFFLGQAVFQK